jgi:long-chain fatty acid transport protein
MKKSLLTLAALAPFWTAYSQGFQLNLQGTKQVAMGQHIAGAALDPSILFYNPGGMGFTKTGISGSFSPVLLKTSAVAAEAGSQVESNQASFETPGAAYATFNVKSIPKLTFGIGAYTPFGSAINWGDNWSGKYLIQNIKLMAISVQPTVSYKITDKLGIGVGFVYTY